MADYVLGIDLSRYRADVPLKVAKQQGVRFLLTKATEGTAYTDHTYFPYQEAAADIYMPFGGYMYWRFQFDAVVQAQYYCKQLGEVQFPPIVDVERYFNVKAGTKSTPIVSVQSNRNHLMIVLDTIEEETGVKPMIYTNWATWNALFGNWDIITQYEVWVANWRTGHQPLLPAPAKLYKIHQFTAIYKVGNYYRGVDANWFNGNEAAFEAQLVEWDLAWNPVVTPPPPPPPTGKDTFVTVEVTKGGITNLFLLQTGDSVVLKVEDY